MKKLLCFDLDGTLTQHSTWEAFNMLLGITPQEDLDLFNLYKEGNLEYNDWIAELMRLYKGKSTVTKSMLEDGVAQIVIRAEAQAAIDDAKVKGYGILILSGAIDVIAKTIATRLGVEECFTANTAVFNQENELIDIAPSGHERAAKLFLLKEYCANNGYELSDVIAVGDGGNDLEIFKTVKGILLGNNTEIASVAWKQIDNLSELNDLL